MTDIEQKALALVNEVARELGWGETKEIFAAGYTRNEALYRAIEQHEAFRKEVSDAVVHCRACSDPEAWTRIKFELERLIIPAPKPDPLEEVLYGVWFSDPKEDAKALRAALEARGLEIREKSDD